MDMNTVVKSMRTEHPPGPLRKGEVKVSTKIIIINKKETIYFLTLFVIQTTEGRKNLGSIY